MMRTATDCTRPADRPRRTFFHENRADLVADEAIEDAARLLRLVEVAVELLRVADGLLHRALGDLVEQHAVDVALGARCRWFSAMCQAMASPSRSGSGAR